MFDFYALWASVSPRLVSLLILAGLDVVLGVLSALVQRKFDWEYLTNYLSTDGLPIVGWLVAEVILWLPFIPQAVVNVIGVGVFSTVAIKIGASILSSLSSMGVLQQQLQKVGFGKDS